MIKSLPHHTQTVRGDREALLQHYLVNNPGDLFGFDPRTKDGWLADRYFLRTAATLAMDGRDPEVTMQVFAKRPGIVAGLIEGVRLIQGHLAPGYSGQQVEIETLIDGDLIEPRETVMLIRGPYRAFAHLETALLGILARRTLVASNTRAAVLAADGKPIIFMGARHDDWRVQEGDGYAAWIGGARSVSTDAGGRWLYRRGVGTMPHAMIAAFGGDTVEATLAFARYVQEREPGVDVVSLVDYNNDVLQTSLAVARAMRDAFGVGSLAAVRVDTSETLVDRSLLDDPALAAHGNLNGVNRHLIRKLRAALDREGFVDVGIIVSGGFTPVKISAFESAGLPVAAYGVGSSLLGHNNGRDGLCSGFDFTADIVHVNNVPQAKNGRSFSPNPRLVRLGPLSQFGDEEEG